MTPLILASSSPRRRELLAELVEDFAIVGSAVEDTGSSEMPDRAIQPLDLPEAYQIASEEHPTLWAWRKAADISRSQRDKYPGVAVLGADTVVLALGKVLGKPNGPEDALNMLKLLRGRKHYVVTGYALVRWAADRVETLSTGACASAVWMRDSSDTELKGYVASGEPMDKAGAYAVQGLGSKLVSRVEGCFNNVVGLPVCAVRTALIEAGVEVAPRPVGGYCETCPLYELREGFVP